MRKWPLEGMHPASVILVLPKAINLAAGVAGLGVGKKLLFHEVHERRVDTQVARTEKVALPNRRNDDDLLGMNLTGNGSRQILALREQI